MESTFKDIKAKARFAFTLAAYPGDGPNSSGAMVRMALAEACIVLPTDEADPRELRELAQKIIALAHTQLTPIQGADVLARYSKDWGTRRAACDLLQAHYRKPLAGIIDNPHVVGKLTQRHYIVERDRSGQWDLHTIAADHVAPEKRVRQAAEVLAIYADQLERATMDRLQVLLEADKHPEVAHA